MIKVDNIDVWGFEHAIRGMRNPMNSWDKSDTIYGFGEDRLNDMRMGDNDLDLMRRLYQGGPEHRKYLRQIFVSMDITAPLYWWKEFDTYKVGTVANSCSTMHKIHAKEFEIGDFSCEHLLSTEENQVPGEAIAYTTLECIVTTLNLYRNLYLETKNKKYWWQMIQLLPSSYNQRRTVTLTYENAVNIIHQRGHHKLDEWRFFVEELKNLPYLEAIMEETNE